MNKTVARYINLALGAVLIIVSALFLRGVVVSKYTVLQLTDGVSSGSAVSGRKDGGVKRGADFAQYASIVERGIFAPPGVLALLGKSRGAGKALVKRGDSLSSISLIGTVVGASGYGFFKDMKSGKQDIFKVGDMVFKVGRLTQVDRLTATIDQSGVTHTLYMPENSQMKGPGPAPGQNRGRSTPFGSLGRPPIGGGDGRVLARRVGEREWTVDKRALDEALSDTGKMLTQARILPYRVDGKTKGFRLSSVQRSGLFALIGLRSGDILLKVNERVIDSPEKGLQLLSGLGGETNITLDILRGGKPEKLNYEIR